MSNKVINFTRNVLKFPLIKIIIGIALINVGTFFVRSMIQLLLSASGLKSDLIASSVIFVTRISCVYYLYLLFVWIFEKRKAEEIKLSRLSVKQYGLGALIGFSCITFIIGINLLGGWITVNGMNQSPDILKGVYHTVFYALLQDIIFYLILFRITEKYLGTCLTILMTGLVFGFEHMLFPPYTFISAMFIFLDVTFIFSGLYLKSRTIWVMLGFHTFYNFIQYIVFGNYQIEGIRSILTMSIRGPIILTGNTAGFETSLIAVIFCVLVGGYYLAEARKRGEFINPGWRK
jgi:hypothetical protein